MQWQSSRRPRPFQRATRSSRPARDGRERRSRPRHTARNAGARKRLRFGALAFGDRREEAFELRMNGGGHGGRSLPRQHALLWERTARSRCPAGKSPPRNHRSTTGLCAPPTAAESSAGSTGGTERSSRAEGLEREGAGEGNRELFGRRLSSRCPAALARPAHDLRTAS